MGKIISISASLVLLLTAVCLGACSRIDEIDLYNPRIPVSIIHNGWHIDNFDLKSELIPSIYVDIDITNNSKNTINSIEGIKEAEHHFKDGSSGKMQGPVNLLPKGITIKGGQTKRVSIPIYPINDIDKLELNIYYIS